METETEPEPEPEREPEPAAPMEVDDQPVDQGAVETPSVGLAAGDGAARVIVSADDAESGGTVTTLIQSSGDGARIQVVDGEFRMGDRSVDWPQPAEGAAPPQQDEEALSPPPSPVAGDEDESDAELSAHQIMDSLIGEVVRLQHEEAEREAERAAAAALDQSLEEALISLGSEASSADDEAVWSELPPERGAGDAAPPAADTGDTAVSVDEPGSGGGTGDGPAPAEGDAVDSAAAGRRLDDSEVLIDGCSIVQSGPQEPADGAAAAGRLELTLQEATEQELPDQEQETTEPHVSVVQVEPADGHTAAGEC
ncbi:hypothetical protein FJT64_027167 [Amphibalanus amphitrite]|uniref:Uncharacterized protein n=1 Tax=Amphibalanus amphitrite TaxID=1232801 RepID=A0A6A4WBQ1_AMPAM|nr:hypothetical protein FJT64_027167 [Amphibalanus amphitrite]